MSWVVRASELWVVDVDFDNRTEATLWLEEVLVNEAPTSWVAMRDGVWIRLSSIKRFDIYEVKP